MNLVGPSLRCSCKAATRFKGIVLCVGCRARRVALMRDLVGGLVACCDCGGFAQAARGRCTECFRKHWQRTHP